MTRKRVAEGKDRAKGIFLTALPPKCCNILLADPFGSGDAGIGDPDRGVDDDEEAGFEKATASRSSCSRP